MKLIKNYNETSTFIADKKGMNTFLRIVFQDDFDTRYKPFKFSKRGKARFKTNEAAKIAFDKLSRNKHILDMGYKFKLKEDVVIGEITEIYKENIID